MADFPPVKVLQADPIVRLPSNPLTGEFRQRMGQISRHSSVFFAGTIFTAASGYFFKVYLARVLGAEALGIYALGITMVGFLSIFNTLGLPQAAVRFVSAYSALGKTKQLGAFIARSTALILILNLLLGAVLLLAGRSVAVRFYHTPALNKYLGLFAFVMLFGTLNTFFGQVLVGYKSVAQRTVITTFVGTSVTILFAVALIIWGFGLWGYILAQVISASLITVLLVAAVWKLTPRHAFSPHIKTFRIEKEAMTFSAVSLGLVFLEFIMAQADKVLIGFYLNARQLGIYAVAMALVVFVPTILTSVNQIFAPTISDLNARGDYEVLERIFQTLTKWILGLTIPLAAMMVVFARPLMRVFGQDFEVGWVVLVIGTLGQLVNCGVGSVGYILLMSGNERRLIKIHTATALIMIVLNIVLIPRWGIAGAAVGSAVTNVVMNTWTLVDVRRTLGLFPYTRSYLRLGPPIAGTLLVLWITHSALRLLRPSWVVMGGGLLLAYLVFIGIALVVGLNADDQVIAQAVGARMGKIFHKTGEEG
jgi:O-antigen/teichoic acid export membrane protein